MSIRGSGRTHRQLLTALDYAEKGYCVVFLIHTPSMQKHALNTAYQILTSSRKEFSLSPVQYQFNVGAGTLRVLPYTSDSLPYVGRQHVCIMADHAVPWDRNKARWYADSARYRWVWL